MRSLSVRRRFGQVMSLALVALLTVPWSALASTVDIAVVDIVAPITSVELAPGESAPIQIIATVTGKQDGDATFKVNTVWTLSGGVWTGSAPTEITVGPRAGGAAATVIPIPGVVVVSPGEQVGTRQLTVSAFGITNSNNTGGKLEDGKDGVYTVEVAQSDVIAPVITVPDNMLVEATGAQGAEVSFVPTAWDETDGAVVVNCVPASGTTFALGTMTVQCTATDAAGNTGSASFTVTVRDTTEPTLSLPADTTEEATGPSGAVVEFTAAASDIVDGDVDVVCAPASGSLFGLGDTVVTCTATDRAGNTAIDSFTVTVQDTTAPTIAPLEDVTAEATSPEGVTLSFSSSASDLVDGAVAVVCDPPSGSMFPLGENEVVCTATDRAGNKAEMTFKITVTDSSAPILTLPEIMVVEAIGPEGAVVTYAPTATDLVDGDVLVTCVPASGSTFALGSATVACTASDTRGNTANGSFTVDVVDTTPPAITVPTDITAEATGPSGAPVDFSASASDLVDGVVRVSYSHEPDSIFPLGETLVTVTTIDTAGNPARRTFTVTVVDTTAPVITVPTDITAEATGADGATVTFSASASDLVDGNVGVECGPASGSTFPLGTTSVVCTATDAAGNEASASFNVTVRDTTPPSVTAPDDMILEATGPAGAVAHFSASARDIVDGVLSVNCAPASGSTFTLGTTTVQCTATDAAGNTGSASFTVTVRDTTAPTLSLPNGVTKEATGPEGAVVEFTATASDIVDGDVDVVCIPPSGSVFALGDTVVNCSARDAAGNTATGSFTVTVRDTTAPSIAPLADITAEAVGPDGASVTFSASATDLVDGDVDVVCLPQSGSMFNLGDNEVVFTATDKAGNVATAKFKVTITDTTGPLLTLPEDLVAEATGPEGAAVMFSPSAYDLVDGIRPVLCAPASGSTFALGTTPVMCTASDTRDNASNGTFSVTVRDTTPPAITVPNNITEEATGPSGAAVDFSASASDLVDGSVSVGYSHEPGSTFPLGETMVTVTAGDAKGNTDSSTFTVTVVDTTAPVLSLPSDMVLTATTAQGAYGGFDVSSTDLVDGNCDVSVSHPSGSVFPLGTTTVVCTATDEAGNKASGSFNVTVTYGWSGYLQPINTNGSSVFKLGSTVPVKFRLSGASSGVGDATARLYLTKVSDGVLGSELEALSSTPASTGNLFRYDAADGQYIYNFGTKGMQAGTYQLRVDLGDGVKDRTVLVSLRK